MIGNPKQYVALLIAARLFVAGLRLRRVLGRHLLPAQLHVGQPPH